MQTDVDTAMTSRAVCSTHPLALGTLEVLEHARHGLALERVDQQVLDLHHVVGRLALHAAPHAPETWYSKNSK